MTYNFPDGGGGGATAFTELTDAPPTISPNALVVGNDAASAVEFTPNIVVLNGNELTVFDPSVDDVAGFAAQAYGTDERIPGANTHASANLYAGGGYPDQSYAALEFSVRAANGNAGFSIDVNHNGELTDKALIETRMALFDGVFTMYGFDSAASDSAARLTVDGASYAVAKAIKVKIGSDTHYWPLFGGEDAGPAPALSVAFTDLTDVAGAYSGLAGQVPRVNAAADGLTLAPDPGHSVALIAGDGSFFGGPAGMYAGACTGLSDGASIECGGGETTGAAGIGLSTGRGLAAGVKGGDAAITFGESGAGAASARLLIGKTTGDFADANNAQDVTYGAANGPGGAAISIKRWIPITVDGHAGWIPHFGV